MPNDFINYVYIIQSLLKTPKSWGSKSFQVGEHIQVLERWCTQREHGSSVQEPIPDPTYSFYLSVPELYHL